MSKKEEKLIKITFNKSGTISKKIKIPNKSEKKAITRAKSYLKEVKENNMNKKKLNSVETWNLLCKSVFEYHQNKIQKLDNFRQRSKYFENLSDLEFKIFAVLKIGGEVNPELVLHKDFPEIWEFFKNKI